MDQMPKLCPTCERWSMAWNSSLLRHICWPCWYREEEA